MVIVHHLSTATRVWEWNGGGNIPCKLELVAVTHEDAMTRGNRMEQCGRKHIADGCMVLLLLGVPSPKQLQETVPAVGHLLKLLQVEVILVENGRVGMGLGEDHITTLT